MKLRLAILLLIALPALAQSPNLFRRPEGLALLIRPVAAPAPPAAARIQYQGDAAYQNEVSTIQYQSDTGFINEL